MKLALIMIFILTSFLHAFSSYDNKELNLGIAYYKTHKYEQALIVFDRLLINNPKNNRIRLEYARTLYALQMYDESKQEFLHVLNTNPPPIVQKNIKFFIKKIENSIKTNFFQALVSVGVSSDSNVGNNTFLETTQYGQFVLNNDIQERKDRFTTAELSLMHMKKLPIGRWINSLYLYDEQSHDQSSDKITFLSLSSSYTIPLNGVRVSLPIGMDMTYVDSEKYAKSISFRPTVSKNITKTISASLSASYQKSKNVLNEEKDLIIQGLNGKFYWMMKKFSNKLGLDFLEYRRINDGRSDISKDQYSFDISSSHPIFETNSINLFFRHQKEKYTEIYPVFDFYRVDKKDNINLSFNQEVTNSDSFKIGYTKSKNSSNINSYSYKKDIYSLKLSHKY